MENSSKPKSPKLRPTKSLAKKYSNAKKISKGIVRSKLKGGR